VVQRRAAGDSRNVRSALHFLAAGGLHRPQPGWIVVAVAAQGASLVAYALVVRELLAAGGVAARLRALVGATVGGIALSASLPGGSAASVVYWYHRLRREGADRGTSARAMAGAMLAGILTLASLLVVGLAVAGGRGPLAGARTPIVAASGSLLVLAVAFRNALPTFAVGRRRAAVAGALACVNWLLDCAALCASLEAVHAHVRPEGILLTYALAQLVASIPLLPGGGGTVEATLVLGFAAFGHTSGSVLAGVVLFRVIGCWGLVPIGWLAVAADRRGSRPASVKAAVPTLRGAWSRIAA
jgi:uncharacterized membrane protein YbhN (UPF0104 family)